MPSNIDYTKLSAILTAGQPLSHKLYPDGSLVVIAHDGKKHTFTADQVQKALPREALSLKERSSSEKPGPKPKNTSRTTRTTKTKK